ncbi:putative lipid II flippase FtsW [Algicola sagamiensis]|uniref:putative lipid II flippase FtsW n=1 Tax=Algicola sagamiensis TaxID=163869 RepID=UPI000377331A|nr:putative lipid II flippase FtsW [Algicola sagamiensis]
MIAGAMTKHLDQWRLIFRVSDPNDVLDQGLVWLILLLLGLSFVMVYSASIAVGERLFEDPHYFLIRHGAYIMLGTITAFIFLLIPIRWWKSSNGVLLLLAIGLLVAVLLVGRTINGSTRWISLGVINVQSAEPAKLFFFSYLAGYLVRRQDEVRDHLKGFMKPLIVLFTLSLLLLMQPDLGTVIVMFVATVGLLFIAGAKLWQFFALMLTGIAAFVTLIVSSEYRFARVTAFMDPWQDPFGVGYQLTNSLMAYGRGGFFGLGLGNGIQKLEYLPEAHTDFIAAVVGEELGFIGIAVVLLLEFLVVYKAIRIAMNAGNKGMDYASYFAYAISIWLAFQTLVNVGGSTGILPTKGLTLPLMSYGGSSLIIMMATMAILLRIDYETRLHGRQAMRRGKNG